MAGGHTDTGWERIERLFHELRALAPQRRAARLAQVCDGNGPLRAELESLLAAVDTAPAALERGVSLSVTGPAAAATEERLPAGTLIGAWRILALVGAGGMGEVYRAQRADGQFEQDVAIKLIRREAAQHLERFQAERQILARLEHPGIAHLLDGGVHADGRPFMVMEFVAGERITDYCQRRGMALAERLHLFQQICEAVAFAHANLVVHRDLKPGNVLVTAEGRVKLLDFGVAKLLDADGVLGGERTLTQAAPVTPHYAAPEQLDGRPITTATDVHALGVLLFELLAGRLPWNLAGLPLSQGLRRLLNEAPPACSAAAAQNVGAPVAPRRLAGDLDAIVAKALRKEPTARYATVNMLRTDVDCYLGGAPVAAGPDSRWYRASKFVRRNRAAVAAAVAILVLIAGFSWRLLLERSQVTVERDRALVAEAAARAEAAAAQQVTVFLTSLFAQAEPNASQGKALEPKALLDLGLARVSAELTDQPLLHAHMLGAIGSAYVALGAVSDAIPSLQRAIALADAHAPQNPGLPLDWLWPLGKALSQAGDHLGAERSFSRALALYRAAPEQHGPPEPGSSYEGLLLANIGVIQYRSGRAAQGVTSLEGALAAQEREFGPASRSAGEILAALSEAYNYAGRRDDAIAAAREAVRRSAAAGKQTDAYVNALSYLGSTLFGAGRAREADSVLREALAASQALFGADSAYTHGIRRILAANSIPLGRPIVGLRLVEGLLAAERKTLGAGSGVARVLLTLGELHEAAGDLDTAAREFREALAMLEADPQNYLSGYHRARLGVARTLLATGRAADAQHQLAGEIPAAAAEPTGRVQPGMRLLLLGEASRRLRDWAAAAALFTQAGRAFSAGVDAQHRNFVDLARQRGLLFADQRQDAAAEVAQREALRLLGESSWRESLDGAALRLELAVTLLRLDRADAARSLIREAAPQIERETLAVSPLRRQLQRLGAAAG